MFEDDYEFTPSSSSKLSSLFHSSEDSPEKSQNNPLFYKAPKETKKEPVNNSSGASTFVIIAKVVHAWKLVDNKYSLIGKLGIAIIGSPITQNEMILYKEQKNVIVRVQLTPLFDVTIKKDNFISFYNNEHENWLVKFSNENDFSAIVGEFRKIDAKISDENRKTLTEKTIEKQESKPNGEQEEETESKAKSDILNRIAKMGQSILPNNNINEENTDDTVESEVISTSSKLVPVQRQNILPNNNINVENTNDTVESEVIATSSKLVPVQRQNIPSNTVIVNPTPAQQPHIVSYDPFTLLCAENRTQNTEVRMNLSQISEKLNQILHIVDKAPSHQPPAESADTAALKSRVRVLELRCENLTTALANSEAKEKQLEGDQHKSKELERTVEKLEEDLACLQQEQLVNCEKFEEKIEADTRIIADLNKTIELQLAEIARLKENESNSSMQSEILQLHGKISDLELSLNSSLESQKRFEGEKDELLQKNESLQERIILRLKEEMNTMYSSILDNFNNENETYSSKQIQSILARNIKITTKKVIQSIQQEDDK